MKFVVLDIWNHVAEKDKDYFRTSRRPFKNLGVAKVIVYHDLRLLYRLPYA